MSLTERLVDSPVPRLGWNASFDGARAISVLAVMTFHYVDTPLLDGSPIAVDIFFVLSGFLITTLLFEEHATHGSVSLRDFYLRRAYRLLPALYALLAFFAVFAILAGGEDRGDYLIELAAAAFYVYNLLVAWVGVEGRALVQLWTLSLEEQFYLLWPLLLVGVLHGVRRRRLGVLLGAMALIVVITPLLRMGIEPTGPWQDTREGSSGDPTLTSFVFGLSLMRPDALVLGCLFAMLHRLEPSMLDDRARRWLGHAGWVAMAMVAAAALLGGLEPFAPFVSPFYNLAVLMLGFWILDLVRRPETWSARLLRHPVLVWVGKRSYGIYIWHLLTYFPVRAFFDGVFTGRPKLATLAAFPFAFALTIGVAQLSWRFVETPALRAKQRFARTS